MDLRKRPITPCRGFRAAALCLVLTLGQATNASAANLAQLIASDSRLALFAAAVAKTGREGLLAGPGPLIVFAPSDQALINEGSAFLLDRVLVAESNAERLADLVEHHVARADRSSVERPDGTGLPTLAGPPLPVARVDAGLIVGRYAVVIDRRIADNGILYVVDRLLWPRDPRWGARAVIEVREPPMANVRPLP